MRMLREGMTIASFAALVAACGGGGGTGGNGGTGAPGGAGGAGSGTGGDGGGSGGSAACPAIGTGNRVPHVIVVIQENHTFDTYFGKWCTAPAGSNPTCNAGPSCCEAVPAKEPSGASPVVLDDKENAAFDPTHSQVCEVAEINGGKMDKFVTGAGCSNPRNFALAADDIVAPYHDYATTYALADRYFQSIAGASAANDMYFAVAKEVFIDNSFKPPTIGQECSIVSTAGVYQGQTVADLLKNAGKTVRFYAEGWGTMAASSPMCPPPPDECGLHLSIYPCIYDPSDIPFLYYEQFANDEKSLMADYADLGKALSDNTLPDVSFVKLVGYNTEHPGAGTKISAGVQAVKALVDAVENSCYKDSTLVLLTWDEGGGYFDHVPPPAKSAVDNQPYGTRVPLLAIGRYAKKGFVSHVEMEHSSVVKFLEYNYLDGVTGQLGARDAVVNNIGSLIDPAEYGETIPDQ